jgi:hypothetical protein
VGKETEIKIKISLHMRKFTRPFIGAVSQPFLAETARQCLRYDFEMQQR